MLIRHVNFSGQEWNDSSEHDDGDVSGDETENNIQQDCGANTTFKQKLCNSHKLEQSEPKFHPKNQNEK